MWKKKGTHTVAIPPLSLEGTSLPLAASTPTNLSNAQASKAKRHSEE